MPTSTLELSPLAQAQPSAADYKRCDCLGKSPLRACRQCFSVGWLKLCTTCFGSGILTKPSRQSNAQGRTERCGRCMGVGWTPCPMQERSLAEELWGEVSQPSPLVPPPAVTSARIQTRRKQIKQSKKNPIRQSRAGISISAERVQNPIEAMEIAEPEDTPQPEPQEIAVAPSSFAPEE